MNFRISIVLAISIISQCACYELTAKRVYVDMVADLFHPGHVSFLQKARQFGDYLIVGLISDEVCKDYKRLPIMTLQERVDAVSACKWVDEVIPASPLYLTAEFLDEHNIDVVIHGDDYTDEQVQMYYGPAVERGIYQTVDYTPGISTSDLLNRIISRLRVSKVIFDVQG